jgi:hypothetical protein
MATSTYNLIGTPVVVGSGGASSITFSSIPGTYTDLKIVASTRSTVGTLVDEITLNINGVGSNTNITDLGVYGTGAGAGSGTGASNMPFVNGSTTTSSTFGNLEIYFPNYLSSAYKSISSDSVTENNGTSAYMFLNAILWSNTSAISSIAMGLNSGGNFVQYSTFYLYGIKNS